MKEEVIRDSASWHDSGALASGLLDFSHIRRIKIFGDSNLLPLSDEDMIHIAQTATNLREILIANTSTISSCGVAALVKASQHSLRLLDYAPTKTAIVAPPQEGDEHLCELFASCPELSDLAVTVPTICEKLFSNPAVKWAETVRIRTHRVTGGWSEFQGVLEAARRLVEAKEEGKLAVEIAVGPWLFDVRNWEVHGNFRRAERVVEEMGGRVAGLGKSVKGPWGWTGIHGGEEKGEWGVVGEGVFGELVDAGVVTFGQ